MNARNKNEDTPLHRAARDNSNPEITAVLLKTGADTNARDRESNTPLHWSAGKNSHIEVTRYFWKPVRIRTEEQSR